MNHLDIYNRAKQAKVGDVIQCPFCRKSFKKKTYNQVFCSNPRLTSEH